MEDREAVIIPRCPRDEARGGPSRGRGLPATYRSAIRTGGTFVGDGSLGIRCQGS